MFKRFQNETADDRERNKIQTDIRFPNSYMDAGR